MTILTTTDDLKNIAQKKVPKMFYDYMVSGSWTETTLKANTNDFKKISFRQRVAVDMSNRTTRTKMLGEEVAMPIALAPTGLAGMLFPNGEIHAARAANKFGVPFTLSTMSICSIEDVADNSSKPFWFQLYVMRDHEFSRRLVNRAKAAGCSALMLTLDLQLLGQRHRDIKNGLTTPPKLTVPNMLNLATKPRWCAGMLKTKRRTFGNIAGHVQGISDLSSLGAWTAEQFDLQLDWDDVARIRDWWGGKFILKGIMDPEDAVSAVNLGADAIIVSNHGGRQLDGVDSTVSMLPKIVKEVGNNVEVWMDGGIVQGQDALKAIALGADATMIGRAYLYGLGALGETGVVRALDILYQEFDKTMALCGHRDVKDIGRTILSKCPF